MGRNARACSWPLRLTLGSSAAAEGLGARKETSSGFPGNQRVTREQTPPGRRVLGCREDLFAERAG